MIGKLADVIAANPPGEVEALIKLMGTVLIKDQYSALVNDQLGKVARLRAAQSSS